MNINAFNDVDLRVIDLRSYPNWTKTNSTTLYAVISYTPGNTNSWWGHPAFLFLPNNLKFLFVGFNSSGLLSFNISNFQLWSNFTKTQLSPIA